MREQAHLRYPRKHRPNWPFRIYQDPKDGKFYLNTQPRRSVASRLDDFDEAPF